MFQRLDPTLYALPPSATHGLSSPALIVWLDHVRANLRTVTAHLAGRIDRWRPHVKTAKIPEIFAEMARAGVRHFKCATTREAWHLGRVLADEGIDDADILVAYPLFGPGLARLGAIAAEFTRTRYSVLCEDAESVATVPASVGIWVDLNPGMNRTGVPVREPGRIMAIASAAGARFAGLHYYDGHLHDADLDARRRQMFAGYEKLLCLHGELETSGVPVPEIVTAGTPAFLTALQYEPFEQLGSTLHRVSPGTVIYHDARSEEENAELGLTPAALLFTRVVSRPTEDIVTCDGGSKSIAAEAGDPCAVVLGRPELVARTPNEEHLPFAVTRGESPKRGTELLLIPQHVCPTVNLAEEAVLVEGGRVRGIVSVAARAHELHATADRARSGPIGRA